MKKHEFSKIYPLPGFVLRRVFKPAEVSFWVQTECWIYIWSNTQEVLGKGYNEFLWFGHGVPDRARFGLHMSFVSRTVRVLILAIGSCYTNLKTLRNDGSSYHSLVSWKKDLDSRDEVYILWEKIQGHPFIFQYFYSTSSWSRSETIKKLWSFHCKSKWSASLFRKYFLVLLQQGKLWMQTRTLHFSRGYESCTFW